MTGTTLGSLQIVGAALFSTCHASAQDVLAGRERPFTAPACGLLVGRARRFTSLVTQMHIEVCGSLQTDAADPPVAVFATCHGEIQTAERLITDFRETSMVSSARFALSVHNTPSGVYSVATGNTAPTTTITGANAIAAGWLEASLTALDGKRSVLLSIADEPVPAVFCGPAEPAGVAAAFLIRAGATGGRSVALAVAPSTSEARRRGVGTPTALPAGRGAKPSVGLRDDAEINPLEVLARIADAWARGEPATVALGQIQPGATLELRFPAQGLRAPPPAQEARA